MAGTVHSAPAAVVKIARRAVHVVQKSVRRHAHLHGTNPRRNRTLALGRLYNHFVIACGKTAICNLVEGVRRKRTRRRRPTRPSFSSVLHAVCGCSRNFFEFHVERFILSERTCNNGLRHSRVVRAVNDEHAVQVQITALNFQINGMPTLFKIIYAQNLLFVKARCIRRIHFARRGFGKRAPRKFGITPILQHRTIRLSLRENADARAVEAHGNVTIAYAAVVYRSARKRTRVVLPAVAPAACGVESFLFLIVPDFRLHSGKIRFGNPCGFIDNMRAARLGSALDHISRYGVRRYGIVEDIRTPRDLFLCPVVRSVRIDLGNFTRFEIAQVKTQNRIACAVILFYDNELISFGRDRGKRPVVVDLHDMITGLNILGVLPRHIVRFARSHVLINKTAGSEVNTGNGGRSCGVVVYAVQNAVVPARLDKSRQILHTLPVNVRFRGTVFDDVDNRLRVFIERGSHETGIVYVGNRPGDLAHFRLLTVLLGSAVQLLRLIDLITVNVIGQFVCACHNLFSARNFSDVLKLGICSARIHFVAEIVARGILRILFGKLVYALHDPVDDLHFLFGREGATFLATRVPRCRTPAFADRRRFVKGLQ